MTESRKTFLLCIILIILFPVVLVAGIAMGSEKLPVMEVLRALFAEQNADEVDFTAIIVRQIRLPRIVLAMLTGVLLAGAGAVFQGFFKSPLADSSMLGVSSGAALGAVFGSIAGFWMPLSAFLGSLASILIVYLISGGRRNASEPVRLLLAGSAVSVFLTSVNSALILVHDKELYKMYVWTLGSFNGKGWSELAFIAIPAAVSLILFIFCIKPLDVLSAGDLTSQALGINLKKTRILCFASGSLATAAAVSAGGIIGFVGLVAPHIVRMIAGSSYRKIIPLSMLLGAVFLGTADILARIMAPPLDIPVGIITSLIGAPFFIVILLRYNRRYAS